jgi:hypothetical protein
MKKWISMSLLTIIFLTGCQEEAVEDTLIPIEVTITTQETLNVHEEIKLQAHVTKNGKDINDADEVKFEVWESGMREEAEMVSAVLTKNGIYEATYQFDHDGVYYVFAHTTARDMHVMPKKKFIVGTPDMTKVLEDNTSNSMDHNNH